jgi:hypothetical protein
LVGTAVALVLEGFHGGHVGGAIPAYA